MSKAINEIIQASGRPPASTTPPKDGSRSGFRFLISPSRSGSWSASMSFAAAARHRRQRRRRGAAQAGKPVVVRQAASTIWRHSLRWDNSCTEASGSVRPYWNRDEQPNDDAGDPGAFERLAPAMPSLPGRCRARRTRAGARTPGPRFASATFARGMTRVDGRRFIPARAGNRSSRLRRGSPRMVHSRACGE